jgi:hypothetical protein
MVTQKAGQQIEEEKAFILATSELIQKSCLFTPDTPSPLTGNDSRSLQTCQNPLSGHVNFGLYLIITCQTICNNCYRFGVRLWRLSGLDFFRDTFP